VEVDQATATIGARSFVFWSARRLLTPGDWVSVPLAKGNAKTAATLLAQPLTALKDAEGPIESAVSAYIGAMTVVWIDIGDEPGPNSQRGRIERKQQRSIRLRRGLE
jgi:hypothetical protein